MIHEASSRGGDWPLAIRGGVSHLLLAGRAVHGRVEALLGPRHGLDGGDGQGLLRLGEHPLGGQGERVNKLMIITITVITDIIIIDVLVFVFLLPLVVLGHLLSQGPLVDVQLPLEALLQLGQVLAVRSDGASRDGPRHHLTVAVLM